MSFKNIKNIIINKDKKVCKKFSIFAAILSGVCVGSWTATFLCFLYLWLLPLLLLVTFLVNLLLFTGYTYWTGSTLFDKTQTKKEIVVVILMGICTLAGAIVLVSLLFVFGYQW
ncbi:MAG: hypothetical protein LBV22_01015 [Mycoplasmataceae bacterium]|nr:hypothetical protein [Mycoplasmataceae bacterium]